MTQLEETIMRKRSSRVSTRPKYTAPKLERLAGYMTITGASLPINPTSGPPN
jgi:hypothetical protein